MKYISISSLLKKKLSFFYSVISITIIILKMSKHVTFYEDAIVKTISIICSNGTNCHDTGCNKEHLKDTVFRVPLNSEKKKKKEVEVLKSTKKQCPNGKKCKNSGCPCAHPWDTVYRE